MTLSLCRVDYTAVGVTSKGTTRILPATDSKQTQKFAVADHDGVLHIYGTKKGELQLLFKSLPGPKINKMILGGVLGCVRDKIFIAYGHSVKGYTHKGKMFLEFDTSLIDPITALYVLGSDLAACARDLYHRYKDCKDADSYLAGETLHDVVLLPGEGSTVCTILACGDCAVRMLHGTKTPTLLRLPSIPTVLTPYREGEVVAKDRILVGTMDGRVGLLTLQGDNTLRITWLLPSTGSEITCMDIYMLQDSLDILVGHHDGIVEVYAIPDEDTSLCLRYKYNAGESISSVVGGIIGAPGYTEVLVTTYSGKIFGLSTKPPARLEAGQSDTALAKLRTEIAQLRQKLAEEKEAASFTADPLAPLILAVNHRMVLREADASYSLSVELDAPIDNVLIQSDTPIELLDVESNTAVADTNRLEMGLRTIEGQPGTLQIYITSQVQPKCCRRIYLPICALSLHTRLHQENTLSGGPFNQLRLIGGFTIAEMHAWLSLTLPNIPERPHIQDGEALLVYTSVFIGTLLKCKYKKGSAVFLGENISSIIILRDMLTKEATKRKIKLDVFCDVAESSISRVLELLLPKLDEAQAVVTKIKMLDALSKWELNSDPKENLSTKFQELLKTEAELKAHLTKDSEALNRLHGVITDLYVDWERAKGSRRISSKDAAQRLEAALQSRDTALLLHAFLGKDISSHLSVVT
ncbi:hypothetical protein KM043_008041 [Ampulex compressa]|nr:hypothetical protein KM043_008041 [Ampulex compressa]